MFAPYFLFPSSCITNCHTSVVTRNGNQRVQQPRAQKLDAACIVVAEANQGMERGLTEDKGLGEGPPQDEACKRVEHRSDMHEEVANRRHKGKGSQERVLAVRIKSVASTCRSWGRCPPVLGMVALRGMLTPSAPWIWTVHRSPPSAVAARSVSQCSHAPWAIDGTRVVAPSSSGALA